MRFERCAEILMLLAIFCGQRPSMASATALRTWCASQGKRTYYRDQSCFALTTTSNSYVNLANSCTEQSYGALAILPTTDIIQSVITNLLQKSSSSSWFIGYVQIPQSNYTRPGDDWFWVDAKKNTYGGTIQASFNTGEPDDSPTASDGLDKGHQNCVIIMKSGILSDRSCTAITMPGICQYREPTFQFQSISIGNKVISSSAAIISGKVEIPVRTTEWCGIMCKTYASCRGYCINKSSITCTLLYESNVPNADLQPNPSYELYGLP